MRTTRLILGLLLLLLGLWLVVPLDGILGPLPLQGIFWEQFSNFIIGLVVTGLVIGGLIVLWLKIEDTKGPKPLPKKIKRKSRRR